ncbi:MAG: hypothetical protein NXH89_19775 [Cyclobacteriaceae bacterium]|nr:hypothetical protein [Cyclobacteriaceae bacterium]
MFFLSLRLLRFARSDGPGAIETASPDSRYRSDGPGAIETASPDSRDRSDGTDVIETARLPEGRLRFTRSEEKT